MKALLLALASGVAAPVAVVLSIAAIGAGSAQGAAAAMTAAATTACVYAQPDPERVAAAMEQLGEPVDQTRWERYAPTAGIDPAATAHRASTASQRHQVLVAAVTDILTSTPPHAVTTPPIIWWHATLPVDDNDTRWRDQPVPGYPGTLGDYLADYAGRYATSPAAVAAAGDTVHCTPPPGGVCPQPADTAAVLATIRHLESGGNYTESAHSRDSGHPPSSGNPSGAYQYLADSWNRHGGYPEAYQAPPAVQDQRAADDVTAILTRFGGVEWVPVAWYVGVGGADKVRAGQWDPATIPNPAHNRVSIGDYQTRWMAHYTTVALPATGTRPVDCPVGAAAAIAWADTQIGAPYAAIDPYRFGAPPWPGGTRTGSRGDRYTFPAGTVVYDCSGFVIAAWRQAGIDLAGQYALYGSQDFTTSQLPDAPRDALQPGDIAVYRPRDGVGHIVLIHHIDPDGTVHTIEASPGGVHIGSIDWTRVTAIKRPPATTT